MRLSKKILSLALSLFMLLGMFPAAAFAVGTGDKDYGFADMPNNWSTTAIDKAIENGLLKGYAEGDKMFIKPDAPLKRAELAAVVNRAFGAVKNTNLSGVTDIDATDWYAEDMGKAVMMGTFMEDVKMRPEANITRQEAFVVLVRAFLINSDTLTNTALVDFIDAEEVADWAKKDINAMAEAGYIKGSNGKLNPNADISRAEFATVMDNLIKQYVDTEGEVTELTDSGNVLIRVSGVTLKNLTVNGDLIIADGVDEGNVTLDNVKVEGRTVVRGGGENSIIVKGNSDLGKVIVYKVHGNVRIAVDGASKVGIIFIANGSNDVFVEGKVGILEVAGNGITAIATKAFISNAIVSGDNSKIILKSNSSLNEGIIRGFNSNILAEKGTTIEKIIIKGKNAKIEGLGNVKNVDVMDGGDNASVTTPNTKIEAAKGVKGVTAAGSAPVESGSSVINNGTGTWIVESSAGGGRPSVQAVSPVTIKTDVDVTDGVENDAVVKVTLTTATNDAEIYYTMDGSIPSDSALRYTGSFNIETQNTAGETVTIRAIGIKSGYSNSSIAEKEIGFKAISFSTGFIAYTANPNVIAVSLDISISGAKFDVANSTNLDNWVIDTGSTNLEPSSIGNISSDEKKLEIEFTLKTAGQGTYRGTVTVQAKAAAVTSDMDTNVAQVKMYESIPYAKTGAVTEIAPNAVEFIDENQFWVPIAPDNIAISEFTFKDNGVAKRAVFDGDNWSINEYRVVEDISIINNPGKVSYYEGESINLAGLRVRLYYSDDSSEIVELENLADKGITTEPENGTVLTKAEHHGKSIRVIYNGMSDEGDPLSVWDLPSSPFAGGVGSESYPYQVATAAQLDSVRDYPDKYFVQTADIDLSGYDNWTPIGSISSNNIFVGDYDGNGYKVSNIKVTESSDSRTFGLFGYVGNATIKNLQIRDAYVVAAHTYEQQVGILAGYISNTEILNCSTTGTVGGSATYQSLFCVGGLIGLAHSGSVIEACYSYADVISQGAGLVSNMQNNVIVRNSYSAGTVVSGAGFVNDCHGKIEYSYTSAVVKNGNLFAGYIGDIEAIGSYYLNSESVMPAVGSGSDGGITGLSREDMIEESSFTDWDFTNAWAIKEGISYPYLQWQGDDSIPLPHFAGGTGSVDNPYKIITPEHLNNVRYYPNAHFLQLNDIDLTDYLAVGGAGYNKGAGWNPIDNLKGSYDGNDKKIIGLEIDRVDKSYVGLFGKAESGASIKKLTIENASIKGEYFVGCLLGSNSGGIIDDCHSNGVIEVTSTSSGIGGLVGTNYNNGKLISCSSEGYVDAPNSHYVGGLVGQSMEASIIDSYSACDVVGGDYYIGGLTGSNYNSKIERCLALGNVTGGECVGGLVGDNMDNAQIIDSYAMGEITGRKRVGGLVGFNYYGGINTVIKKCYSTGKVNGDSDTGGLVGRNESASVIESYWDIETSLQNNSSGGIGKNTEEMHTQSTFESWDFFGTWGINPDKNGGYPFLKWQGLI